MESRRELDPIHSTQPHDDADYMQELCLTATLIFTRRWLTTFLAARHLYGQPQADGGLVAIIDSQLQISLGLIDHSD